MSVTQMVDTYNTRSRQANARFEVILVVPLTDTVAIFWNITT